MEIAIGLFIEVFFIVICHTIAKKRGSNPIFWAVMGGIFGPLAIPFVFLSKPKKVV